MWRVYINGASAFPHDFETWERAHAALQQWMCDSCWRNGPEHDCCHIEWREGKGNQ